MSAGPLNKRLRFDQRASDANGDRLGVFVDGFAVWASVAYPAGTESVLSARLAGVQPVVITIRDTAQARAITPGYRAVGVRGVAGEFNIKAVAPARRARFLEILAESGVAPG